MNHIAMVIPGIDRIAGAERQMVQLANGLRHRGWRVSVVALSGSGGEQATELIEGGIGFLSLAMRKGLADPRGWIRFQRWLRRERPDVVHSHLPHAMWLARWSRLGTPVRVLVDTLHSSATGPLGRRLGYRWSHWIPDKVTAVSNAAAEAHLLARMVTSEKLAVVANGVDVERWRPDAQVRDAVRRELGLEGAFLWLAAGRLDPVKNYPTLLQAMVLLPEPARLMIAGAGRLENELRCLARDLGLERRVRFLGFEPNVCRLMQAADAFVLSSQREGLPMAILEAAACRLPVVATDVPGTREAVIDGETGLLAEPENADALRSAMTTMMQNSLEERRAMGERGRKMVVDRCSLDKVLDRWEELYEELLRKNPIATRWALTSRI